MNFAALEYLYLFWILPAMVLLAIYSFRKKDQLLRLFADTELWDRLMPDVHRRRQTFKFLLLLAAVGLLLTSFLRPRWGFHWEEIKRKGVDLIVAVDVSESMLAEDIRPNRLERAKREITDLVGMLKGDRVGLIAFAGAAFLECPLTLDYGSFRIFLDYLDTELIPVPGTAIGEAIQTAIRSFSTERRASKALVLITDGEDHPGEAEKAAEEAKEKGIRIFTIGIGSEDGAPIPLRGGKGDFKKDRKGQVVMSRLRETALQKIALATGGSYVRSVSGDMDLKKIYEEEIRGKMEAGELKSTKKRRWEERFQWFLFGSILLLALESLLPDRKRPPAKKSGRPRFALRKQAVRVSLLGLGLLFSTTRPAEADSVYGKMKKAEESYETEAYAEALEGFLDAQVERPEDIRLKYNIGSTQYRMRGFGEAEEAFWGAANAGDPELKQKAFYNLGNTAYRQGKLEDAVAHYKQALDLDPEDEDARFNLEFVREEIKRRLEEAQEREKKEKEEKQEGQTCQQPQPQQGESQEGEKQKEESQGDRQETPQQPEPTQQESPRQPEQGQEQPGSQERKDPADARQQAEAAREMSPEDAERWLNTLDEEQKEMARQQVQKALGRRPHIPDKDW
jgi:Ca-activated chloride channel family protein